MSDEKAAMICATVIIISFMILMGIVCYLVIGLTLPARQQWTGENTAKWHRCPEEVEKTAIYAALTLTQIMGTAFVRWEWSETNLTVLQVLQKIEDLINDGFL